MQLRTSGNIFARLADLRKASGHNNHRTILMRTGFTHETLYGGLYIHCSGEYGVTLGLCEPCHTSWSYESLNGSQRRAHIGKLLRSQARKTTKSLTIISLRKGPLCSSQLVCSQESACFIVAQAQPLVQYENKREIMDSG